MHIYVKFFFSSFRLFVQSFSFIFFFGLGVVEKGAKIKRRKTRNNKDVERMCHSLSLSVIILITTRPL